MKGDHREATLDDPQQPSPVRADVGTSGMTRIARRYLVRKSQSGYWLSYFLSVDYLSLDRSGVEARMIYRIMGVHDSMRSAMEGIYE